MGDENTFKVIFETQASGTGAKEIVNDLKGVTGAAKEAGAATEQSGQQAAQGVSAVRGQIGPLLTGIKTGKLALNSFAQILSGDVSNGVKGVTLALKGLKVAFATTPIGFIATGLTLAAGAWTIFKKATADAAPEVQGATGNLKDLSAAAKDSQAPANGAADGIGNVGDKAKEAKTFVEQVAEALKKSADSTAEVRKKNDQLIESYEKLTVARINLQEAEGKMTPEQAAAARRNVSQGTRLAEIQGEMVDLRRQNQNAVSKINEAQSADYAARDRGVSARKSYESALETAKAGSSDDEMSATIEYGKANGYGAAQYEAQKRIESAKSNYLLSGQSQDPQAVAKAKADLDKAHEQADAVDRLADSYQKLQQAQAEQQKTQKDVTDTQAKANETIRGNQDRLKALSIERETVVTQGKADDAKAKADQQKKEADEKAQAEREQQRQAEEQRRAAERQPKEAKPPKEDVAARKRDEELSSVRGDVMGLADEARKAKGASPEKTERLHSAAAQLAQAARGGGVDAIAGGVDQLAEAVGQLAGAYSPEKLKALEASLMAEVAKVKAQVAKLQSDQGRG